jgi:hypothetical protein
MRSRNGKHTLTGKNSFSIDVDTSGLDSLMDELSVQAEEAVRPAAQAAAQVLYEAVKQNVNGIGKKTGNLANSIYQVYSQQNSNEGRATYHVSWNHKKAPHGHLVEYGHIQRYATYVGKNGKWYTAVRPEARGKPKPRRKATQAEKDAYYVLRPGGPAQIAARSFVRRAASAFPKALDAAEAELLKRMNRK